MAGGSGKLCSKCQRAQAKGNHCYCADCLRTYHREWARRKRGSQARPFKPEVGAGEKFCGTCGRILPIEQFSRSRGKADGRMSMCKMCDQVRQSRYRQQNRRRVRKLNRERSRRWRAAHPDYNRNYLAQRKRERIARKLREAVEGRV